jgi:hypothetical protein
MIMRKLLLTTALVLASAGAQAQQTDPYPSYRQQQAAHWAQERQAFVDSMNNVYYAAACKVIDLGYTVYIFDLELQRLRRTFNPIWIDRDPDIDYRRFTERGQQRSDQSGCDFWKQNPEAVYQVRQMAITAWRIKLPNQPPPQW